MRRWINLCETTNQTRLGYRIVSHAPATGYATLSHRTPYQPVIGTVERVGGNGLYLGTSQQFCLNYYSGGTDDADVMLTYEYHLRDLLAGYLDDSSGEIRVRQAKLLAVEHLDNDT